MNKFSTFCINFFIGLVLLLVVVQMGGATLAGMAGFVHIDAWNAFLYPEGDTLLIALPQGRYQVGPHLTTGCYWLAPARDGQSYGHLVKVWPFCAGARTPAYAGAAEN